MDSNTPPNMILLLIWCLLTHTTTSSKAPPCCSGVHNDKCRRSCNQVHSQASPTPQVQMLLTAAESCPPEMTDFWKCVNDTLPAVKMMSAWPGKFCCDLARSKDCRKKCHSAESKDALLKFCRESSEQSLYGCIQRQDAGKQCCSKATASCGIVCHGIYITGGASSLRAVLAQHCHSVNKHVELCVHKQWYPQSGDSENYLPCCDKAQTSHCRSTCRTVLQTVMSEEDIIEELIQACSQPQPTDPLWQCFLNNPNSKKNETTPLARIDNAKLQCCGKASSDRCRDLCTQTYKSGWSYHTEFDSSCSYLQPVSTVESNLHNCLVDVDQPCKLGCAGLSFCSNFNHRPTELFRSCTAEADDSAYKVYNSWKNGVIHLPQMTIPVKDISQCRPSMWKAIACALEIKPCSSQQSLITLCKEDCLSILTKCVDATKLSGDKTVPALCNALPSRLTPGACISMDTYQYESPHASHVVEVNHPCNPSPCSMDEVCLVRRRKCKHLDDCLPYVCHKACPLGQVSKVLVPKGSSVRLANLNEASSEKDCHVTCHCSSRGHIENCKHLICLRRDICVLGHDNTREHGDQFTMDGSQCICYAGKVLCSRRSCQPDSHSPLYTGMPGNCPAEYEPVCGANGKTYPNGCMAKCAGVSNIIANKACSDEDVCTHKPCPAGLKCVPRHQTCLNEMPGDYCPQFECVDEIEGCNSHVHDPACSSSREEFTNICMLYTHQRTLAYRGHCQSSCSDTGVVCGHDGETYSSECAARAARVTVDYFSRCRAFGNLTGKSMKTLSCSRVKCPAVYPSDCVGIVPPGACCPICAAQLKLLWDPRLMSAAASHTTSKVISTMDVLNSLSDQVSVVECDVFGYVSVNGELIVIIAPLITRPSGLQVEACQSEAGRIHSLLKIGSPNLVSYLMLSPLLLSSLERSIVTLNTLNSMYTSDPYSPSDSADSSTSIHASHFPSRSVCVVFVIVCRFLSRDWL
ncbi:hypothetical protein BsWGS_00088 [Bradybaena similaris]